MLYLLYEIQKALTSTPVVVLIQWTLQCYFFSQFVSKLLGTLLKTINFAYAKNISSNSFVIVMFTALLIYLRLWSNWSGWFLWLAFACSTFVALYVYDCTCNVAEAYTRTIHINYLLQLILYTSVTAISLGYMYWLQPQDMYYVIPMALVIFSVNFLRGKHVIFSVLMVGSIVVYIGGRWTCSALMQGELCTIPFHAVPLLMMALDAESREASRIREGQDSLVREVLWMSTYFLLYAMFNMPFPFEYPLFGVWALAQLLLR